MTKKEENKRVGFSSGEGMTEPPEPIKKEKPFADPVDRDNLEDLDIQCADCNKILLNMVRVRPSGKEEKLIVNCPYCEGQSWLQELVGDYFQAPPKGLMLGDMDEKDGLYELNMELKDD